MTKVLPKTLFAINKMNILVLGSSHIVSIYLRDYIGAVSMTVPYELLVEDDLIKGESEDGYIDQSIDESVKSVKLTVWPYPEYPNIKKQWRIDVDVLEASDTDVGKLKRLSNLGYVIPEDARAQDTIAIEAVKRFKKDHGLTSDDQLIAALTAVDSSSIA